MRFLVSLFSLILAGCGASGPCLASHARIVVVTDEGPDEAASLAVASVTQRIPPGIEGYYYVTGDGYYEIEDAIAAHYAARGVHYGGTEILRTLSADRQWMDVTVRLYLPRPISATTRRSGSDP